jgi:hypothetical protein
MNKKDQNNLLEEPELDSQLNNLLEDSQLDNLLEDSNLNSQLNNLLSSDANLKKIFDDKIENLLVKLLAVHFQSMPEEEITLKAASSKKKSKI